MPANSLAVFPAHRAADIGAASHCGCVRSHNQDSWYIDTRIGLVLVADGVGGQGDGSWASATAVRLLGRFIRRAAGSLAKGTDREKIIAHALQFAHQRLRRTNRTRGEKPSGTTIVGLWTPFAGGATIFNAGDSSLFRLSSGVLEKLSRDHSVHQLWVEGGRIGAEPSKRMIVQAMGISNPLLPRLVSITPEAGDVILACSDGLTGTVPSERIAEILAEAPTAKEAADGLIREALKAGAPDNVTAAVYRF